MEEIIQVENQYYVLATSSLADDRTRVLKYGATFAVLNRLGDVESIATSEQGLYHRGTRYLSRLVLRLGKKTPQLLRSTIQHDNAFLTLDMMNLDVRQEGRLFLPRGSIHLFRSKFLWCDVCYDKVRLANFCSYPIETSLSFEFAADYADIFQVRGTPRTARGHVLPAVVKDNSVLLSYLGLDQLRRSTRLGFDPEPTHLSEDCAEFAVQLQPKEEKFISVAISCEENHSHRTIFDFDRAMTEALEGLDQVRRQFCSITTSNHRFNSWLQRSQADLLMMINGNPEGAYPYAGVPWFSTVFGRDGILTSMECLSVAPWIARGVLKFLAETQATAVVPEQEAEPGKIIHELRHGEMANLREVPFGRYYGSVDATPLFVALAGAYLSRSDDLAFVEEIWPNILAALDWIETYGDADRDGFVEYNAKSPSGLVQQGWKDSSDSVFHRDGSIAPPPIALCEVQGYVYAAQKAAARMAARLGFADVSHALDRKAERLKHDFQREFWDPEIGSYVLALDGEKKPCRVLASNAGHCLWSGIATDEHAGRLAATLLSDNSFCGWGIRTLGSGEIRYNPMSYHNGSVWPHDNALIAGGLAQYGYKKEARRILEGLFEASSFMDLYRLPELFCGFHKRSDVEGPTLYPVACAPQAWAAASVYLLIEACLGIRIRPAERVVEFCSPLLPDLIDWIEFTNLQVGSSSVALRLHRDGALWKADISSPDPRIEVRFTSRPSSGTGTN